MENNNNDKIVRININEQCKQQYENMVANGFSGEKNIARDLMLIVSELSEALEADRNGSYVKGCADSPEKELLNSIGKQDDASWKQSFETLVKNKFEDEIADAMLRIMHLCGMYGIDIDTHVAIKSYYNSLRTYKHGKKY